MKRIISLLLVVIMMASIVACNDTPAVTSGKQESENAETPESPPEETPEETPGETEPVDEAKLDDPIELLAEGSSVTVVIPANADRNINYASDRFINGVKRLANAEIALGTAEQEVEILIGDTGRAESETLKATLGEDEFAVKLMGKKLVVVATEDAFLYEAVGVLLDFIKVDGNADVADGSITLKRSIDVKQEGDKSSYVYLFAQSTVLTSKAYNYVTFALPDDEIRATQGGCYDGTKYFYQGYIWHDGNTEANNKVIIVKYDFERKVRVAQSEILSLNHCNDMTYVPDLNLIAVVNHGPNKTTITFINPETLTVEYTKKIAIAVYAIAYNHERNRYATGVSNSRDIRRWESDLTFKLSEKLIVANKVSDGYTTQGICADENFIYCVFWDSKNKNNKDFQNIATVYDWYGNYVGVIEFDVGKIEPENIFIRNGSVYVTCHSGGAKIYKLVASVPAE